MFLVKEGAISQRARHGRLHRQVPPLHGIGQVEGAKARVLLRVVTSSNVGVEEKMCGKSEIRGLYFVQLNQVGDHPVYQYQTPNRTVRPHLARLIFRRLTPDLSK